MLTLSIKLAPIALSLSILGQAYLIRLFVGTWLFPACLFSLFWFGMSFVPLVLLFSVPISPWGMAYIFAALCAFSFSAFFLPWKETLRKYVRQPKLPTLYNNWFLKRTFYSLSAATILCIVLDSMEQGFTLSDLIFNLILSAQTYRSLMENGWVNGTMYQRVAEILVYAVAILGGLLIGSAATRRERAQVLAASFAPGCLLAIAHSTKWALFSSVAFFYAGVLAYRVAQGNFRLFAKGAAKKVIFAAAVLAAIATLSFMSRGLAEEEDWTVIANRIGTQFASYSSGHLYAFSDWCAANVRGGNYHTRITYAYDERTYGYYTFSPIFRALGSTKVVPPDIHDEYFEYANGDGDMVLTTNIYTMFRDLYQDFGVVGSLVFMFLMGLVIHLAFYAMLTKRTVLPVVVFIFSIGFSYASFGRSLFSWSGIYFTFVVVWIVLEMNKRFYAAPPIRPWHATAFLLAAIKKALRKDADVESNSSACARSNGAFVDGDVPGG